MKLKTILVFLAVVAIPCLTWGGMDRPYDDTTKRLIDNAKDGVDRFKDKIHDKFKVEKIIRGGVETDVSDYLDDLKKSAEDLEDRYKLDYAANPDALEFLKKAKTTDAFMSTHQGQTGADTEWLELRSTLTALAAAYNIDWEDDPANWRATRATDAEVKQMASNLENAAKEFDKSVDKAGKQAHLPDSSRKDLDVSCEYLKKATKTMKNAVGDKKPVAGALDAVLNTAEDLRAKVDAAGLSASVSGSWASLDRPLNGLASAFGRLQP